MLQEEGATVFLSDPYVKYWSEENLTVETDWAKAMEKNPDIIVFTTGHSLYRGNKELVAALMAASHNLHVYDTIGILTKDDGEILESKVTLSILGKGNSILGANRRSSI